MRLKSVPDQLRIAGIAESDPLPPDEARPRTRSAFLERLYRAQHDGLVRFIRRRGRGERAHDVVQQVFCRLAGLTEQEQQGIVAPAA